jgi:molecular chaperone HtpG
MQALFERDAGNPVLREYSELLYNQALLLEGSRIADPAAFSRAVSRVMAEAARAALEK